MTLPQKQSKIGLSSKATQTLHPLLTGLLRLNLSGAGYAFLEVFLTLLVSGEGRLRWLWFFVTPFTWLCTVRHMSSRAVSVSSPNGSGRGLLHRPREGAVWQPCSERLSGTVAMSGGRQHSDWTEGGGGDVVSLPSLPSLTLLWLPPPPPRFIALNRLFALAPSLRPSSVCPAL